MIRLGRTAACAALALLLALSGFPPTSAEAQPVTDGAEWEVLFLGDPGLYHDPAARYQQILPVMADRGISITYTEDVTDLDPETLSHYDALLVYGDIYEISQSQEQALVNFVEEGGGFVPIHAASGCFRNSEAYVRLVGGAFASHEYGVFTTDRVNTSHPAIEGLPELRSWDETYVHKKHNPDKTVLAYRGSGEDREPWTWVRTQGEGRVFYTAWGHDGRTWSKPAFHDLLERGIRWAMGEDALEASPPEDPFEYTEVTIPSLEYESTEANEKQETRLMQEPLSVEEEMEQFHLPGGFKAQLFAAEPMIVNPIAIAWDDEGRLYVAETVDYPNELVEEPWQGSDRISILEDTNGDGRADEKTVFAENLSIPTGMAFYDGGLVVAQPPHTLFLKDTDGDDRADQREVLFSGWGTFDTHASANHFTYGLDNQIWGTLGYSGFEGEIWGEQQNFSQGFYRFDPEAETFEVLARTNNNTWGFGQTEEGYPFASTANANPSVHMPIPMRYYLDVQGLSAPTLSDISDDNSVYPITDKTRQGDWKGRYTSASGHDFYTARLFPKKYWNKTAFVADPTVRLLGKFRMEADGSAFVAKNKWNMMASRDQWTTPIGAKVGPDGALWVQDWYNFIPQHNLGPFAEHWEHGDNNAYVEELRDRDHGRIYRILPEDHEGHYEPMSLEEASAEELVEALTHTNMFWRLTAQRKLVERGETDVAEELYALIESESIDAMGLDPGAIHALWTLEGLGLLEGDDERAIEIARQALYHPSAGVRRNALKVLPGYADDRTEILEGSLLQDVDGQVRRAAFLTLADAPSDRATGEAVFEALLTPNNSLDRWIPDAATAAGAAHPLGFVMTALTTHPNAIQAGDEDREAAAEAIAEAARAVARDYASTGPQDAIAEVLLYMQYASARWGSAVATGLAEGWPEDVRPNISYAREQRIGQTVDDIHPDVKDALGDLTEKWDASGLFSGW